MFHEEIMLNTYDFERIVNLSSKDTEKGAERVARVFYRILRRNNFSKQQIIDIATNLITCLTKSLKSYEEWVETKKKRVEEGSVKESS